MVYRISAPTPEEKDEWIHSIKYVSDYSEVFTNLQLQAELLYVFLTFDHLFVPG